AGCPARRGVLCRAWIGQRQSGGVQRRSRHIPRVVAKSRRTWAMTEAMATLSAWAAAGEPLPQIAAGALVAVSFVVFNAVRVFLYVPQIATCWQDTSGCPTINLVTWLSWLVANASTGLYMWMFQSDVVGLCLNLGNAVMCAITVGITLVKRKRYQLECADSR